MKLWRRVLVALGAKWFVFETIRYRPQSGLVLEVCPDCREPYRAAEMEFAPGRVGTFLLCRCGTVYQDPRGRREMVHGGMPR